MIEVFVNERYSLVARLPARRCARRLTMRSDGMGASVQTVRISALKWANP